MLKQDHCNWNKAEQGNCEKSAKLKPWNAEQFSEDLEIELQVIESTFRSLHKFCHIIKDIQGHFLALDTVLIVSPTCTYGANIELLSLNSSKLLY